MNTSASTRFRWRGVERIVRGQPTSDGDGVKLTRVLIQSLQQRFDPFLMLDAFGSDAAADYSPARVLLVAGRPLGEAIAQYGPFVMNTTAESQRAVSDFEGGVLAA